jgi:uncharacterized membrane protein
MYTLTPMEILFRFKDPHFILTSLALIGYACIPFAFLPLRSWYLMSLLPFVVWAVSFKYMGIDSIGWHQGYYYIHFLYIAFVDGLNIAVTSWSTGGSATSSKNWVPVVQTAEAADGAEGPCARNPASTTGNRSEAEQRPSL